MREENEVRPSGGDGLDGPRSVEEQIDEAGMESFPCSDPPAFNVFTVGPPRGFVSVPPRPRADRRGWRWVVFGALAAGALACAAVVALQRPARLRLG